MGEPGGEGRDQVNRRQREDVLGKTDRRKIQERRLRSTMRNEGPNMGRQDPRPTSPLDPGLWSCSKDHHQTLVFIPLLPGRELPNPSGPQLWGRRQELMLSDTKAYTVSKRAHCLGKMAEGALWTGWWAVRAGRHLSAS